MKEKIIKWYNMGLWTESMVRNAVEKGKISEEDFAEIIGTSTKEANEANN